jgi:hypothetical protein
VTTLGGRPPVDETTEEFSARMVAAIDSASLTILLSIGHQTGLLPWSTGWWSDCGPERTWPISVAAAVMRSM